MKKNQSITEEQQKLRNYYVSTQNVNKNLNCSSKKDFFMNSKSEIELNIMYSNISHIFLTK